MISVCIATYNGEKYIAEQITSILQQLSASDEIVVSDDCSTDGTMKILESFGDSRIKIFPHKRSLDNKHQFYPATRNFENALLNANGDYIFLADQDDVWLSNKVETVLPFLQADNLVISDAWIVNSNLEKQDKLSKFSPYKNGFFKNLFRNSTQGCVCAFTKKIKDFILPFPKGIIIHDFWLRLLCELKFNVIYIPEPLILYRRHPENLSDLQKSKNSMFFMVKYRAVMLWECAKRCSQKIL